MTRPTQPSARKKIIRKITREKLDEALRWLGWQMRHCGCEHYRLLDSDGRQTDMMFFHDHLTLEKWSQDERRFSVTFYMKDCYLEWMPNSDTPSEFDAVSLCCKNDKSVFILFWASPKSRPAKP